MAWSECLTGNKTDEGSDSGQVIGREGGHWGQPLTGDKMDK